MRPSTFLMWQLESWTAAEGIILMATGPAQQKGQAPEKAQLWSMFSKESEKLPLTLSRFQKLYFSSVKPAEAPVKF